MQPASDSLAGLARLRPAVLGRLVVVLVCPIPAIPIKPIKAGDFIRLCPTLALLMRFNPVSLTSLVLPFINI